MRNALTLLGNVVFAASTVCGLFLVTAKLSAQEEPSKASLSSVYSEGLWTREPTRVDPSKQNFERVEAAPQSYLAQAKPVKSSAAPVQVASLDPTAGAGSLSTDVNSASSEAEMAAHAALLQHQQWCSQRYRSYDAADDSYRSFSGAKRTCVSPYSATVSNPMSANGDMAVASETNTSGGNIAACQARYRSYDIGTNTYQPFDGGPRRQCQLTQ